MRQWLTAFAGFIAVSVAAAPATAAEIKVLTAGAFKQVLLALAAPYEQRSGNKVAVENDTVGALVKRIESGAEFDVTVLSPAAVDALITKGKIAPGSRTLLAKVGIGVVVKEGAAKPDIGTVEAFKRAVLAAKSVSYIDPASGGSSGIYIAGLLQKLGIAEQVKPKAKLIPGGLVAEHIANGEAELGIAQISEIIPVKGVTLVGPLPAEIQNYTTYAAGIAASAKQAEAAGALIKALSGPDAAPVIAAKGMQAP